MLFVTFIVYSFGNESVFDNLHQSCAVLAIKSLWETQDVQFIPHLIRFHFLLMFNRSLTSSAFTFYRCSIHPSPHPLSLSTNVQFIPHLIRFHFLPFPLNSIRICPALSLFPPADNLSPVSLHFTDRVQLVGSLMTWCSISNDHLCNQI